MKYIARYNNTGKKIRTLKEVSRYSHRCTANYNSMITHKNVYKILKCREWEQLLTIVKNKRAREGSIDIKNQENKREYAFELKKNWWWGKKISPQAFSRWRLSSLCLSLLLNGCTVISLAGIIQYKKVTFLQCMSKAQKKSWEKRKGKKTRQAKLYREKGINWSSE